MTQAVRALHVSPGPGRVSGRRGGSLRTLRLFGIAGLLFVATFLGTRSSLNKLYAEPNGVARADADADVVEGDAEVNAEVNAEVKARVLSSCSIHPSSRVFVGFSKDMDLDDFESAATHAQRILHKLRAQLCRAWGSRAAHVVSGFQLPAALRATLNAGTNLSITDVLFTSAACAQADVRLSAQGSAGGSEQRWLVRVARARGGRAERDDKSWTPVTITRE